LHLLSPVSSNDSFKWLNDNLPFLHHDTIVKFFTVLRCQNGSSSNTPFIPVIGSHHRDTYCSFRLMFDLLIAAIFHFTT